MSSWTSVVTQTTGGWASVANATVPSSIVARVGEPIGLLMALTHGVTSTITGVPWTNVDIQTSGGWTSVATQNT